MSIALHRMPKFLITPSIRSYEGMRGYVSHVAQCNNALSLVQPALESLSSASRQIAMFADLTATSSDVLRSHGSCESSQGLMLTNVRFGNILIPADQVWQAKKRFCPPCLKADGVFQSCWDLKLYVVCHKHGCRIVDQCSECGRRFRWNTGSPEVCSCGFPLSEVISSVKASYADRGLSKLLSASLQTTFDFADSPHPPSISCRYQMLDWILFLFEFIKLFLIPAFSKCHRTKELELDGPAINRLILTILVDQDYREILHKLVIMMYASGIIKNLDGNIPPEINLAIAEILLSGHLRDILFHKRFWKLHLAKPMRNIPYNRLVKRPIKTPVQLRRKSVFLIPKRKFESSNRQLTQSHPGVLAVP